MINFKASVNKESRVKSAFLRFTLSLYDLLDVTTYGCMTKNQHMMLVFLILGCNIIKHLLFRQAFVNVYKYWNNTSRKRKVYYRLEGKHHRYFNNAVEALILFLFHLRQKT